MRNVVKDAIEVVGFFSSDHVSFPHLFGDVILLRGVYTVVHKAILPRTFVRVRPSRHRTRTKVRVCVRVRRPPAVLDFLYVVQKYELAVFR